MAHYLFQVSYTTQSWFVQVTDQPNVLDRVKPLVEACHGVLECLYYAFGSVDAIAIIDFPTPEDAAAFSLAVSAGGAVKEIVTTPLMTVESGMDAMHRAAHAGRLYRPPVRS